MRPLHDALYNILPFRFRVRVREKTLHKPSQNTVPSFFRKKRILFIPNKLLCTGNTFT
jgi:hypothetical protein